MIQTRRTGTSGELAISAQIQARRTRFAQAASHSARVRLLRWLVPGVALALIAGFALAMTVLRLALPNVDVDFAASAIVDGKLVIADPRLDGFTPDKRAYRVSARSATQEIGADPVTLTELRANIELEGGVTAFLSAESGVFDPNANVLQLGANGLLETTDGATARFSNAEVDFEAGTMVTPDIVTVSQPGTQIIADSLRIEDNGNRLLFENNVSVVIEPSAITAGMPTEQMQ